MRLVWAQIRSQMQYPASFAMQTLSGFLSTFVELLAILIFFRTFRQLGGWSVGEVALLYGMMSVAFGITDMVGAGFDRASALIRLGEFDRVLTRPLPAFLQVLATDFQLRRLGRIAQGVIALGLAQAWLQIDWTLPRALVFGLGIASSSLVFFTVLLAGAGVCFWTIETTEAQNIFTYGGVELTSYPMHIYNRWVRAAFLYVVPLALTSYYPALYVLGRADPLGLPYGARFVAPAVAALFFVAGWLVWRAGLRHYKSTGS